MSDRDVIQKQLESLLSLQAGGVPNLEEAIRDAERKLVLLSGPSSAVGSPAPAPAPAPGSAGAAASTFAAGMLPGNMQQLQMQQLQQHQQLQQQLLQHQLQQPQNQQLLQMQLQQQLLQQSLVPQLPGAFGAAGFPMQKSPPTMQLQPPEGDDGGDGQQQGVVSTVRSCTHNSWDNVRTKKGQVFLRCRICDSQWRTPVDNLQRCTMFAGPQGCDLGDACTYLHLHARKRSLAERVSVHGFNVLDRVSATENVDASGQPSPDNSTAGAAQLIQDNSPTMAGGHNMLMQQQLLMAQQQLLAQQQQQQLLAQNQHGLPMQPAQDLLLQQLQMQTAQSGGGVSPRSATGQQSALQEAISQAQAPAKGEYELEPCTHNDWDNVRTKKGHVFMRCRECERQWRTPVDSFARCQAFIAPEGCPKGRACELVHLHAKKRSLQERVAKHGTAVLEKADFGAGKKGIHPTTLASVAAGLSEASGPASMEPSPQGTAPVIADMPLPAPPALSTGTDSPAPSPSNKGSAPKVVTGTQLHQTMLKVRHTPGASVGITVKGPNVIKVEAASPAALAGFRVGMMVREINGTQVGSSSTKAIVGAIKEAWLMEEDIDIRVEFAVAVPQREGRDMEHMSDVLSMGASTVPPTTPHAPTMEQNGEGADRFVPPWLLSGGSGAENRSMGSEANGVDMILTVGKIVPNEPLGVAVKGDRVTKVAPSSAAARAGLQEGMRIVAVNGTATGHTSEAVTASVRDAWLSGQEMQLHVRSAGSTSHPPPLEASISDGRSEGGQSHYSAYSYHSQTGSQNGSHSPYNMENDTNLSGSFPPLGKSDGSELSRRMSDNEDSKVIVVRRSTPQEPFGARVKGNTISFVEENSCASLAGLMEGMTVMCVNGKSVGRQSLAVVTAIRSAWSQEAPMELTVRQYNGDACSVGSGVGSTTSSRRSLLDRHNDRRGDCSSRGSEVDSNASDVPFNSHDVVQLYHDDELAPWRRFLITDTDACVRGWQDRPYELEGLHSQLMYSYLIRTPHRGFRNGSVVTANFERDAYFYAFFSNAASRSGGFDQLLKDDNWSEVPSGMSWSGTSAAAAGLCLLRRRVSPGDQVVFPSITSGNAAIGFFVSPLDDDGESVMIPPQAFDHSVSHVAQARSSTVPPPPAKRTQIRSSTLTPKKHAATAVSES